MSALSCISCHVAFSTAALHREHYKSDWHRYNLMRKVAELPAITYDAFQQRAAIQQEKLEPKQAEDNRSYCDTCRKYFGTENALTNHFQSKKHLETVNQPKMKPSKKPQVYSIKTAATNTEISREGAVGNDSMEDVVMSGEGGDDDDDDWESVDGDATDEGVSDENPLGENQCLFCSKQSDSLENHVQHMTTEHSFFVPDVEYLIDLSGLMNYLGQKVGAGRLCLWCSKIGSRRFHTIKAAQQHMLDKGHCKMFHEDDSILEYTDFYDYSSSYPEEVESTPDPESEVDIVKLDGDDWQLVLPSGATIGHRSLRQYFKQNIRPTREDRPQGKAHHMITHLMSQYKALGWTGTTSQAAVQKARDLKYMRQLKAKHYLRMGQKANKFQPHLRPQVIF